MATGYTQPGATCCCGGGGGVCCSYGDNVTDPVCVTLPTGWPTALFEDVLGGKQFVLPYFTGCEWTDTFAGSASDGMCTYSYFLQVRAYHPAIPGDAMAVDGSIGFTSVTSGGCGLPPTHYFLTGGGTPTAVVGCRPQTMAGATGTARAGFDTYDTPAGATVEDAPGGVCPAALMAAPRLMAATAPAGRGQAYRPPPPARPRICLYADRVEHLAGCSGFRCRHRCTSPDPGVRAALGGSDVVLPADECQDCPGYVPRP